MKSHFLAVSAVAFALTTAACAEEPACKLKVGDGVGAYKVVKAGGIDDGVEVGKTLCYM